MVSRKQAGSSDFYHLRKCAILKYHIMRVPRVTDLQSIECETVHEFRIIETEQDKRTHCRPRRLFMKSRIALIIAIAALTGSVFAGSKGNEAKGKFYFRQNCKQCHTKGAVGGEITPLNKKISQWHSYFETGKHGTGKEDLTKYLTPEQLRDVQAFLEAHAADSLQPETCGK